MIPIDSIEQGREIMSKGEKVSRRAILETSGKFEQCLIYKNKLYEVHLAHQWIYNVYQLEKTDKNIEYKDREEPRVNVGFYKHNFPQNYDEYLSE